MCYGLRQKVKDACNEQNWLPHATCPHTTTHSRSSSFMSSNAPRSTTLIWFSISCLQRDIEKRG